MILRNENSQRTEAMKRISVRIIQSLSDYPANMALCQVEEVVIVGAQLLFTASAGVQTRVLWNVCFILWKAVAFCAPIEIISMRIETITSFCDSCCVFRSSAGLSPFTFQVFWITGSLSEATT